MSGELMCLEFERQQIRVVGTTESPEWVVDDLCKVLQIKNAAMAACKIPPQEKGISIVDTLGGPQKLITVKEPGLYRLISRGRTQQAERFRTWLFNDVIPSIRRHKCYPPPELTVRESAIVRIDEEALGRALGNALNTSVMPRLDQLDERVDDLTIAVSRIEKRQELSDDTKRMHVNVARRMFSCRCPCCNITPIVDVHSGKRLPALQFDHWYLRSQASVQKTWPVCFSCNQELRDDDYKQQCEVHFRSYQTRRKQLMKLVDPRLPGFEEL